MRSALSPILGSAVLIVGCTADTPIVVAVVQTGRASYEEAAFKLFEAELAYRRRSSDPQYVLTRHIVDCDRSNEMCITKSVQSTPFADNQIVVAMNGRLAQALAKHHSKIQIVFASVGDPSDLNISASDTSHPLRITGAITSYGTLEKLLEIVKTVWPDANRIGVLAGESTFSPKILKTFAHIKQNQTVDIVGFIANDEIQMTEQMNRVNKHSVQIMIVPYSVLTLNVKPETICKALSKKGIPTATNERFILIDGCLLSFNQIKGETTRLLASQLLETIRHGDASKVPYAFGQTLELGLNLDTAEKFGFDLTTQVVLNANYILKNGKIRDVTTVSNVNK